MQNYRRFDELRAKAKSALKSKRESNQDKLQNAMIEIFFLHENDIPEYRRDEIQDLKKRFLTIEAKGEEGTIRASINSMSESAVLGYIRRVENL